MGPESCAGEGGVGASAEELLREGPLNLIDCHPLCPGTWTSAGWGSQLHWLNVTCDCICSEGFSLEWQFPRLGFQCHLIPP